jgi:hypothetical protein
VIQPTGVLGSSFATPLISGLAALLAAGVGLDSFREVARLGGLGTQVMGWPDAAPDAWSDRRQGVIDRLFLKADNASPHPHHRSEDQAPCPECSLFAVAAYVNFGLLKLEAMDLDGAELLLRAAFGFAPRNADAAANLGMVFARRAERARDEQSDDQATQWLRQAVYCFERAVSLQPDDEPFGRRLREFANAAEDPQHWAMAP